MFHLYIMQASEAIPSPFFLTAQHQLLPWLKLGQLFLCFEKDFINKYLASCRYHRLKFHLPKAS